MSHESHRTKMTAKVTLKDIAVNTGFTINTVSRALKDKDNISPTTRKKIKSVAKEMGYIANSLAGSLRSGLTKTIAVIFGDISNPHFGIIAKEIERSARKHDYTTFVINTEEDELLEEKAIISAISKNVDGIILCPTQESRNNIEFLQRLGVPFVLLGRHFYDENLDYVVCDDFKGGYEATNHLIERGHTHILFLNGPEYISSSRERLQGYKEALKESNVAFDPTLVQEIGIKSGDSRQVIKDMINDRVKFTAILAFSDMVAWEVIYIMHKMGKKVPQDYAVVGFDNIQARMFFPFPLTTISNSKSKMSRRAFDILMSRINEKNNSSRFNEMIDTRLIIREST
jgi:LacI family transcriptional regulator